MKRVDEPDRSGGWIGIRKPDAQVEIVRSSESRPEIYNIILPRQDRTGWRLGRVEAAAARRELIAPDLCGARSIHLSVVQMAVGLQDTPHFHVSGEKVMYVVRGHGRIVSGEDLDEIHEVGPGDAIYVPPFAVHAPANIGDDIFEFVMASNAPLDVTVPGGTMPAPDGATRGDDEERMPGDDENGKPARRQGHATPDGGR
jgi:uncharacterized RmlC-like cupin family protein